MYKKNYFDKQYFIRRLVITLQEGGLSRDVQDFFFTLNKKNKDKLEQ